MTLIWTLTDQPDCLAVEASGQWQIHSVLRLIGEIAERCHDRGYTRVFCDIRGVKGPQGSGDRYLAGARVASELGAIKVAVLAGQDAVITGFGVNVAANRGGRMLVTKDAAEARQWLFSA